MEKKIRVLMISSQYPPIIGGGGSYAYYLANELANNEYVKVNMLTTVVKGEPGVKIYKDGRLVIHRKDFDSAQAMHHEGAIKKGLDLCRKFRPDIIHGNHVAGALVGMHLKASFGIPLVVTLHKTPQVGFDESITKINPTYSYIKLL